VSWVDASGIASTPFWPVVMVDVAHRCSGPGEYRFNVRGSGPCREGEKAPGHKDFRPALARAAQLAAISANAEGKGHRDGVSPELPTSDRLIGLCEVNAVFGAQPPRSSPAHAPSSAD
jgi:hypothetical protein